MSSFDVEIQSEDLDGLELWQAEQEWQEAADFLDGWVESQIDEVNAELQCLEN